MKEVSNSFVYRSMFISQCYTSNAIVHKHTHTNQGNKGKEEESERTIKQKK